MSKTPKSITVIKDFPGNIWGIKKNLSGELDRLGYEQFLSIYKPEQNPDFFLVEYEPESVKRRYWPNGAIFDEPGEDQQLWVLSGGVSREWDPVSYSEQLTDCVRHHIVFDSKAKAEACAAILKTNLKIERKLQEINLENNYFGFALTLDFPDEEDSDGYPLGGGEENKEETPNYYLAYHADNLDDLDGSLYAAPIRNTQIQGVTYLCKAAAAWFMKTEEFTLNQKISYIKGY